MLFLSQHELIKRQLGDGIDYWKRPGSLVHLPGMPGTLWRGEGLAGLQPLLPWVLSGDLFRPKAQDEGKWWWRGRGEEELPVWGTIVPLRTAWAPLSQPQTSNPWARHGEIEHCCRTTLLTHPCMPDTGKDLDWEHRLWPLFRVC